mmetsp:Transcript_3243/g.5012  ORF Transcript_3243/g.5012 Transcript_3243/m.5012 type:complete len:685 (+) Transcript_3243:31-2085(+)
MFGSSRRGRRSKGRSKDVDGSRSSGKAKSKKNLCSVHGKDGKACNLGYSCIFFRRRLRPLLRNNISGESKKRYSPAVHPSSLFGFYPDEELGQEFVNREDWRPPELSREGLNLPPPGAFTFRPKSSSDEEEDGGHADVSELEADTRAVGRRSRNHPMGGITVIPEDSDQIQNQEPGTHSPSIEAEKLQNDSKGSRKPSSSSTPTSKMQQKALASKAEATVGYAVPMKISKTKKKKPRARDVTSSAIISTSGDEADVDTEYEGSISHKDTKAESSSYLSTSSKRKKKRGGASVSRMDPSIDSLSDCSQSSANTNGSMATRSSASSIPKQQQQQQHKQQPLNPKKRGKRKKLMQHIFPCPEGKEPVAQQHQNEEKQQQQVPSLFESQSISATSGMELDEKRSGTAATSPSERCKEEENEGRKRGKRRKLTMVELCTKLDRLDMQQLKSSNFGYLIVATPDLLRTPHHGCSRPAASVTTPVEVRVSCPKIAGEAPSLGAGHTAVPSPCGPILMSTTGETTMLDITRASTSGSLWTTLPPFPGQSLHFATANLINSTVAVFGGSSRSRKLSTNTFLFSLTHGRWVSLLTTGTAPAPRMHHVAVGISGEYLLVHGGTSNNQILADVYRLHLRMGRWVRCRCREAPALAHHTANLYGRHLVLFGGTNGNQILNEIYVLNLMVIASPHLKS